MTNYCDLYLIKHCPTIVTLENLNMSLLRENEKEFGKDRAIRSNVGNLSAGITTLYENLCHKGGNGCETLEYIEKNSPEILEKIRATKV